MKEIQSRSSKQAERGNQQREANYKGTAKEEEVSRVLSRFSLTLRPRTNSNFFFTNRRLIASVFNSPFYSSRRHIGLVAAQTR